MLPCRHVNKIIREPFEGITKSKFTKVEPEDSGCSGQKTKTTN